MKLLFRVPGSGFIGLRVLLAGMSVSWRVMRLSG